MARRIRLNPLASAMLLACLLVRPDEGTAQTWRELTFAEQDRPAPRAYAGAAYDSAGQQVLLFGGRGAEGDLADLWALDLPTLTWTNLTPAEGPIPAGRRTPAVGLDEVGRRFFVWSGQGAGGTLFDDVWVFDLATGAWRRASPPTTGPLARYGAASVFDPAGARLVTFAGFTSSGRFEDTWAYQPDSETWSELAAGADHPPRRCLHAAAYDGQGHRMIVYGGQQAGPLDDIWAFDLQEDRWSPFEPAIRPPARYFPALAVHDPLNAAVVFGGNLGSGRGDDVWVFDLATGEWSRIVPEGEGPSAREGTVAVSLGEEGGVLLFGGLAGSFLNEVWLLEGLTASVPIPVEPSGASPSRVGAMSVFPNPASDRLRIRLEVPVDGHVLVEVVSPLGVRTDRLLEGIRSRGPLEVEWKVSDRASGVYLIRARAGGQEMIRRVVIR